VPRPDDRDDSRRIELIGDDLSGARLQGVKLRGAEFREADLSDVRMRGVWLSNADLDGDIDGLRISGVEVAPLLEAELDRRHPERAVFKATDPVEMAAGWSRLEAMWSTTVARVVALPPGTEDESVDGEWSFAQTLRHLVLATDAWLGKAILQREHPFHPLGLLFSDLAGHEAEYGIDAESTPTFADVLDARESRMAMVRDYIATLPPDALVVECVDPWGSDSTPSVLACLRVIFNEEWQHHRYAVRDLDTLEAAGGRRLSL
jgi:hypothetical protein